ncbi:hypothetical protein [Nocardia sp. NPDC058666]|uniref:MmyB family transcriptional regulator n=1 Tax=Nocardia sp. NPDC058666 TaxID=3346587 RepID=UPI0036690B13
MTLVAELETADATFRRFWTDHAVGTRRHTTKSFNHADLGAATFEFETLHLHEDGLRISCYTAAG